MLNLESDIKYIKGVGEKRAELFNKLGIFCVEDLIEYFPRGYQDWSVKKTVEDCEKVKECYNLAYKNFTDVLTKAGLEPIKAEGETFDPNFHEAVMQTPSTEHPEHTIIAELQKGYKLGDKVLRPTLVNVATEG